MGNYQKSSFYISGISLFIAMLTLLYSIFPSKFKELLGDGELLAKVEPSVEIRNNLRGVFFSTKVNMENIGYKPLVISRIIIGIANEDIEYHHVKVLNYEHSRGVDAPEPFELRPSHYFNATLNFSNPLTKNEEQERNKLKFKISENITAKYISEKDILYKKIYLDKDIFESVKSLLIENARGFQPSNYHLYVAIEEQSRGVMWENAYRFEIESYMIESITKIQAESYNLPDVFDNKFMTFAPSAELIKEKDPEILKKLSKVFNS